MKACFLKNAHFYSLSTSGCSGLLGAGVEAPRHGPGGDDPHPGGAEARTEALVAFGEDLRRAPRPYGLAKGPWRLDHRPRAPPEGWRVRHGTSW